MCDKDLIYGLPFSPSGRMLASGSRDDVAILWEVPFDRKDGLIRQIGVLRRHSAAIMALAFSHQGDFLAAASSDRTIRL